ncbi:MAG: hypothetical protein M3R51_04270, partial [Candidatus Eremiobacteraeota bacterium]|nr:hypothetical protein [Candidatus Eremiobacteraeota bacterium]
MKALVRVYIVGIIALLAACGGGGGGGGGPVPTGAPSSGPSGQPTSPVTPTAHPTNPPTPIAINTQSPPPGLTFLPSSWARIAPFQVFDLFTKTNTSMSPAQIAADAYRYPLIWGSMQPAAWAAANPTMQISQYYIPEE